MSHEPRHPIRAELQGRGQELRALIVPLRQRIAALAIIGLAVACWRWGASSALPAFACLAINFAALGVIDVRHHRLPDLLVLPAFPVGTVLLGFASAAGATGSLPRGVAAAVTTMAALGLLAIGRPGGLGLGDVKLGGIIGLHLGWLSWSHAVLAIATGFVLAGLWSAALYATGRANTRTMIALGPFLITGTGAAVVLLSG